MDETDSIEICIIHSPLVGPATTTPLASALHDHGYDTVAPDLRHALDDADTTWRPFVDAATRAAEGADVLVAHSGAGVFLPLLAATTGATTILFVDAVVPDAAAPSFVPPAAFTSFLDTIVGDDGQLAPWHRWWSADTVEQLVPDPTQRTLIETEIPRVRRSFYDEPVPLPEHWTTRTGGFVHLSGMYEDDAALARTYGWPVLVIDGHHLDLATRAGTVASMVIDLLPTDRRPAGPRSHP
jgi:hypothetical protein